MQLAVYNKPFCGWGELTILLFFHFDFRVFHPDPAVIKAVTKRARDPYIDLGISIRLPRPDRAITQVPVYFGNPAHPVDLCHHAHSRHLGTGEGNLGRRLGGKADRESGP